MTAVAAPESAALPITPEELRRIPLPEIYESPLNPRLQYDEAALKELAASLLASGQLTPVLVRPRKGGGYELAAGHRRRRAAMIACKQSTEGAKYRQLDSLLAIVRPLSDREFIEALNIENLQREDLHPLEEAQGFRDLMEKAGYDVAKIAARIGRSTRYVYDSLTLLKLTPAARKLFLAGVFERGHAVLLARLSPADQARAIGDLEDVAVLGQYAAGRESLLLRPDTGAEGELALHERVKSVSVREFQHAIQREIRATPDRVDPFLFPESATALEAAKEEKLSVIHITRSHRVSDEARDEKIKTYGQQTWERADGGVEEDFYTGKPIKSKPCAFSRYGFVAAGPGQGEVFRVCINKDKCKVHWPEQVKKAQARTKAAKTAAKRAASGKQPDAPTPSDRDRAQAAVDRQAAEEKAREDEHERWREAMPALLHALARRIENWGQPGAASRVGKYVLRHTDAVAGRSRNLEKVMKPGRTSEDFVRYIAFVNAGAQIENMYDEDDVIAELALFGLDAQKIVDRAVPKPRPAPAQPAGDPKQATCPQCGAKPGSPCKRPSGHTVFGGGFHAGRGKPAAKPPVKKKAKK